MELDDPPPEIQDLFEIEGLTGLFMEHPERDPATNDKGGT